MDEWITHSSWNPEVYEDEACTLDHVRQRITCERVAIALIPAADVGLTDNTVHQVNKFAP